jgi:hypothetical protein
MLYISSLFVTFVFLLTTNPNKEEKYANHPMIKSYVVDFFDIAFISILLIFIFLKLMVMLRMKVKDSFIGIFVSSLLIYDKQSVKNTFNEDLQRYFRLSNKINRGFYLLLLALVILYLLMSAI